MNITYFIDEIDLNIFCEDEEKKKPNKKKIEKNLKEQTIENESIKEIIDFDPLFSINIEYISINIEYINEGRISFAKVENFENDQLDVDDIENECNKILDDFLVNLEEEKKYEN